MSLPITVTGNLTADPEVRSVASGDVANFTVASTQRALVNGEWVDRETIFYRVAVWNYAANVVASLRKGHRVVVVGRLVVGTYKTAEGAERVSFDLTADEVGVTLRYATAEVTKSVPLASVAS